MWIPCILDSSGGAFHSISVLNPERPRVRRAARACFFVSSRCDLRVLSGHHSESRFAVQFAFRRGTRRLNGAGRATSCCFSSTRCESCVLTAPRSTSRIGSDSEAIQKALQALEKPSRMKNTVRRSLRRHNVRFLKPVHAIIDCYRLAVMLGDDENFSFTEEALSELHNRLSQDDSVWDGKRRNLHKLVMAFHELRMRAAIPLSTFAVFDVVGLKVGHLRRFGITEAQALDILTTWPEDFLLKEFDAKPLQYFRSIGFSFRTQAAIVRQFPHALWGEATEFSKVVEFLESLGMSRVAIEKVVAQYPQVLAEEIKLKAFVASLKQLGADAVLIRRRIVSGRRALHLVLQKDLRPLVSRMQSINMDTSRIRYILETCPRLPLLDVEKIDSVISYIESTLDVPRPLIGEWVALDPALFSKEVLLRRTVDFFVSLGFDRKTIGKMLLKASHLINLDVETNLMPTANYLRELGLDLKKVLVVKPTILGYSVENKFRQNVAFLEDLVGRENVASVLRRNVSLLMARVNPTLSERIKIYMDMGFKRSEIATIVVKLPSALSLARSSLLLKHRFFVDYMKRDLSELVRYPGYFAYNIRKIIARFQLMGDLFPRYSLFAIYSCSDRQFEKQVAKWRRKELRQQKQRKSLEVTGLKVGAATVRPE